MGDVSYLSFWTSQNYSAHLFPLPCIAVTITFIEEGPDSTCLSLCPCAALDVFWSSIYNSLFLFFPSCVVLWEAVVSFSLKLLCDDGTSNWDSFTSGIFASQCKCWLISSWSFLLTSFLPLEYLLYKRVTNSFCHLSSILWSHFLA